MTDVDHKVATRTLHFDLQHAWGVAEELNANFWVKGYRSRHDLQPHTPETREHFRATNAALAQMPDEHLERLTHFAEDVILSEEVVHHVRVHFDGHDDDGEWPLPGLAGMHINVPSEARSNARAHRLESHDASPNPKLMTYGVEAADLETSMAADDIMTPLDTAKCILFHHPDLASIDKDVAAETLDTVAATGGLNDFATAIAAQGPATPTGGYAQILASVGADGETYKYDPDGRWSKSGETVYHYRLSDETTGAAGQGPLRQALTETANNIKLQNKKWTVNEGTPAEVAVVDTSSPAPAPMAVADAALADETSSGYTFTLNNKTPGHGLDIKNSSLNFDTTFSKFSIGATNSYLRTLGAYVVFKDDSGAVLTNIKLSDGSDYEGHWGGVFDFPSDGKYFVSLVTAVNTILGIPMPTDPTTVEFVWPDEASEADLLWGGIGTSHWDGDVVAVGFIGTGIFQYGVPIFLLAAGAAIESSSWYKKLVEDKELMFALKAICAFLFAAKIAAQSAIAGVKSAMASLGDAIAGILVDAAVKKLAEWVFMKVAVASAEDAVPFVGWAVRVANMVITAAQIAETTVEVLTSPAVYTLEVKRELNMQLTMHPDPTHGRTPEDAIWPPVASHWIANVQYKDGTNYQKTGPIPTGNDAADPVVVDFVLPAGNQLEVKFGVYSDTNWLAGHYQSAWMDALLPSGKDVLSIEGAIQENLVPLTAQTQYQYKQKTTYDDTAQAHVWHEGDQPTEVVGDLNESNTGNNLGGLVNLTINNKAYMLGYCWTASGQIFPGEGCENTGQMWSFANMSTLANPETGYKFSECGFSDQPFITYDQFGPAPLFNLTNDTSSSSGAAIESALDAATVTSEIEAAFAAANYPITDASIEVVTATAEWVLSVGKIKTYQINRVTNELQVSSYPQPPWSPNNFYADPVLVDGEVNYYLRRITLDETTPFGVDSPTKLSFGKFTVPNLDAFAVHPAGYVLAASWKNSKLLALKLPAEPVADKDAEPALFLSGEGVRQGLMYGPTALTVTSDGRILVLETVNKRIQALDINGNPVHCFDGDVISNLSLTTSTYAPDLNSGYASVALREAFATAGVDMSRNYRIDSGNTFYTLKLEGNEFQVSLGTGQDLSTQWTVTDTTNGTVYDIALQSDGSLQVSSGSVALFSLTNSDQVTLDLGSVDSTIIDQFNAAGHPLPEASEVKVSGNGFQLPQSFEAELALGQVTDALRAAFTTDRAVDLAADATVVPSVTVDAARKDKEWIVADSVSTTSYKVTPMTDDAATLTARYYNATMPLHEPGINVNYLDMATEMKGYIYVLANNGGSAPKADDYYLDIYAPSGEWLSRTPDGTDPKASNVNAAKLIVDQWRTMFTLNFEHYQSNHGTEPSVSEWVPSTPKS